MSVVRRIVGTPSMIGNGLGTLVRRRFAGAAPSTPESSGNDTRRRMDWLVLLPAPPRPVPEVLAVGDFTQQERQVLAEHFDVAEIRARPGESVSDVVLVTGASLDEARSALQTLAPSGVAMVLCDHDASRSIRNDGVDSEGAPLRVLSRHWVLPSASSPRRFVPLGRPEIMRWYLRHLFVADRTATRLASRSLELFARWAGWFASDLIVVFTGSASAVEAVELPPPRGAALCGADCIVLTSGHDAGSRTVVLPFEHGAEEPACAIKVAGQATVNDLTRGEHVLLRELHDRLPTSVSATLPVPLGAFDWHGRAGSAESILAGPTLTVVLGEERSEPRKIEHLDRVARWTTALAAASGEMIAWDDSAHQRWIESIVSKARVGLNDPDRFTPLFDGLVAASARLVGTSLPTVRRHFDLGPWNILSTPDGVGVIDWESGLRWSEDGRGLPLCDLDYFAKYWLHAATGARDLGDELRLFAWFGDEEHDSVRRAARRAVETSAFELNVDERFIPVLVAHHWIERALYASERSRALGLDRSTPEPSEEYLARLTSELKFS